MPKRVTSLELPLRERASSGSVSEWLYQELRTAIVDGRLTRGTRLPASRDIARQYGLSRGTALAVFEQLRDEGYLRSRTGAGSWVSDGFADGAPHGQLLTSPSSPSSPLRELLAPRSLRPFLPSEPAVDEFPIGVWSRLASRQWRRASRALLASGDVLGYAPLRRSIAEYLAASRGVRCSAEQVLVVNGTQQALDLLARLFLRPGDAAWIEDPGYFGATAAFRNAGARIAAVPVDDEGLDVAEGQRMAPDAKLAYVTPAHQCPLGAAMSAPRRAALLRWAEAAGAMIVEDDYDSEYRYSGKPIPALQGQDRLGCVILAGSFNKVLFPSLRLGYIVVPERHVDAVLKLRFESDLWPTSINQAIVAEFIADGHLGRHIRRMRVLYAERLDAFRHAATKYVQGALEIPPVRAGLATAAFYRAPVSSLVLEREAAAAGVTAFALERFAVRKLAVPGLVLGFAAFDARAITSGMQKLARVLERHPMA